MNMKITVPESAEGKRAFVEGVAAAVNRIQSYAVELFLRGGHEDEVPSQRLRDMANELMLDCGKHVADAQKLEAEAAAKRKAELDSMTAKPEGSVYDRPRDPHAP